MHPWCGVVHSGRLVSLPGFPRRGASQNLPFSFFPSRCALWKSSKIYFCLTYHDSSRGRDEMCVCLRCAQAAGMSIMRLSEGSAAGRGELRGQADTSVTLPSLIRGLGSACVPLLRAQSGRKQGVLVPIRSTFWLRSHPGPARGYLFSRRPCPGCWAVFP